MLRWVTPVTILFSSAFYWFVVFSNESTTNLQTQNKLADIVITAPVQVLMYGGDRFLAANVEQIRGAAQTTQRGSQDFRLRAYNAVSILNPCHEDNYWFGNASLSWGGAVYQGLDLLRNATHCRSWDEWPPFFYGFNQNFFLQNTTEAQRALEIAAQRSLTMSAAFRTYATMVGINVIANTKVALRILERERDNAKDKQLKEMLHNRVVRLQGLLFLRETQAKYEEETGQPLQHPNDLIKYGYLDAPPKDPLNLGYEFRDHSFHLTEMKTQ